MRIRDKQLIHLRLHDLSVSICVNNTDKGRIVFWRRFQTINSVKLKQFKDSNELATDIKANQNNATKSKSQRASRHIFSPIYLGF